MGSNSSKFNNCCSCLETQVGEDIPKKDNVISLQKNNTIISKGKEIASLSSSHLRDNDQSRLQKPFSICFIGEKQSGKTTLINALRGKQTSQIFPTTYPERNIMKIQTFQKETTLVMTEVDFDYISTFQGKKVSEDADLLVFILKQDEGRLFRDQIRKIASHRASYKQQENSFKFVVMVSNDLEQIKHQTEKILTEYSLPSTDIYYYNKNSSNTVSLSDLLSQMTKLSSKNKLIL